VADFDQLVADPSAALDRAVTDFFGQGGVQAMVALTSSEDAPAITGALDTVATWQGWDLLVVPALGALPSAEWLPTATAMAAVAQQSHGVALLDPPSDAVAAATADGGAALVALAQQLRATGEDAGAATLYSSGLYSSGLVDGADEGPVATAPVAAGVIAATDAEVGPWGQPGGPGHPIDDVTPGLTVDNALAATFNEAGITPVMTLPGFGTVLMGTRTLSQQPDQEYLSTVRTVGFIERSIELALQQYVFDANDSVTWSKVTADVSQFLTGVWQEGGLAGATAADAFSVAVGVGSTMTAQDVLDGYMEIQVTLELGGPARTIELTFSQVMQGV
jgi:phage tail sheath protein FI